MADGFIRLLQMTVLPYVTLSIVANIGKLTYVQARLAGNDQAWVRYVNTWIQLKKRDGFIDALYQQWILGRAATRDKTRWSILRDVLGW